MPPLPISQQPDWNNNIYVLATTRILVMVGAAYLVKSLYTLIRLTWGTRSNFLAAGRLSSLSALTFTLELHRAKG